MDDLRNSAWPRAAAPVFDALASLRALNRCFLELAAAPDAAAPLRRAALGTAAEREAAAGCPYALFDIRFQDERYWRPRLAAGTAWRIADTPPAAPARVDFVRLALFFVWHLARTDALRAQVLVGLSPALVTAFGALAVDRVVDVAQAEAAQLAPRWQDCPRYWDSLQAAVKHPAGTSLRRAQLYGIQFAAAARLP